MTRHGGRIIDAIVLALILLLGIQSAAQVPENLFSPGLGLPNVVGLGQILLASCGALVLCAYWRQRRWLIPAASLWGAGVVLASSAASVAWSGFSWSALVASFVAASLLGAGRKPSRLRSSPGTWCPWHGHPARGAPST